MLILDAIDPLERVKLTGQLSAAIKTLSGEVTAMQRIKTAKQMADILERLGAGVGEAEPDAFSDDPNAENYRYKDTGYIAGSRKEMAQSMIRTASRNGQQVRSTDIDWAALEENPRQAAELVTKSNLFGKTDWEALKLSGMDSATGFLIDRVYASIGTEPSTEGHFGRKDYAVALETIRARLEVCKTPKDVTDVLDEIRDELNGVQLNSDEVDQYKSLQQAREEAGTVVRSLRDERDALYRVAQTAKGAMYTAEHEVGKRKRRNWAVSEDLVTSLNKAKAEYEAADEAWGDKIGETKSELDEAENKLRDAAQQMRALQDSAHKRNVSESPLTRGWITFGEKFFAVLNWRSSRGSGAFAGHVTNARAGKIADWSWADKDKSATVKTATKQEIGFQLKVIENYERKGGKQISVNSTADLKDKFGFRDVQSGNWVLKDPNSAKFHVEQTAAAMSDMADILGIDMGLLGYGGRLGMAFGARGSGGKNAPRAHYEPIHRTINLTKMGGGGSLGHEWFHSFDNVIHEMVNGKAGKKDEFITSNPALLPAGKMRDAIVSVWQSIRQGDIRSLEVHKYTTKDVANAKYNVDRVTKMNIPNLIKAAGSPAKAVIDVVEYLSKYRTSKKQLADWTRLAVAYYHEGELDKDPAAIYVRKLKTGSGGSSFYAEAVKLDDGVAGKYWSETEEMAARAFQAYLEDKLADADRRNDYLSAMADNKYYKDPLLGTEEKPFPEGEERTRINAAFDKFFASIRDEKVFEKAIANKPLMDSIFGTKSDPVINEVPADFGIGNALAKVIADSLTGLAGKLRGQ